MYLLFVMNSSPAHLTWITTAILRAHATQASDDKQDCNPNFVLYEFFSYIEYRHIRFDSLEF